MLLGDSENPDLWKENICIAIKDLADIEMQKMTWSGKHPKYISSFTETIALLYDNFDFKRYIQYYKSFKGEDKFYKLIFNLDVLIKNYEDYGYKTELLSGGHEVILNDVNWIKITDIAKAIYLAEDCKSI